MPGVLDKLVEWLKMYETTHRTLALSLTPNRFPTLFLTIFLTLTLPPTLPRYKTTEGKGVNFLTSETPKTPLEAAAVVAECHASWKALKARGAGNTGFWLGG